MDTRKIPVFCYWNGCIKDGPDGPFYEGSSPRVIRVDKKIELSKLLDDLHRVTGFEQGKFKIDLIGRYPSIVQQPMVKYMRLPVVDECSLETMLEVPSYHPCINNVELYLEVNPVSGPVSHQSPLADNVSSSANQATQKCSLTEATYVDADVNVTVRNNTLRTPQEHNNNGLIEYEQSTDAGNCGNVIFSSLWLEECELQVGMRFRDKDELAKAVRLYSNRRQRKYIAYEYTSTFECRRQCGWALKVAKTESNGFEIIEHTGPHSCKPEDVSSDFLASEIEGLIKAQPSLSITELNKWVKDEFGYTVSGDIMWNAKKKAFTAISGDLNKSFSLLPKFMAALSSSNEMLVEWQHDHFPATKGASFHSVFWAFQQSIEGFPYCRPLILVDSVDLSGNYRGKMLVAVGLDAENRIFPLAFAIITEESLSAGTWRWFFRCIRKKVTQREGLCLITSPNPDIIAVVNEPECHWAQHRVCLRHLCCKFYEVFQNNLMTEYVYKAGSTSYKSRVDYYLKKLEKMNPEARIWLDKLPLHQWTLAHDVGGLRFGVVLTTNTIFRTYDFINKARNLPVTTCILLIFDHLAELFKSRHGLLEESMKNRREVYAKHVMAKLEEYKVTCRTHDVLPLDQSGQRFQVTEVMEVGNKKFFVQRSDWACTCGIWQLYKHPCSHVIAVCRRLNIEHLQYVNEFYNTENFLGVYAAAFNPLPGVSDWPGTYKVPRLFPPGSHAIH
ncbi:Zinc finger SWIM-type [Arabidopsis suecica]|uniref:Zinc finger SWIM-type n=1 Tax=Arabidopsis suecica TaxID=45249 RepID=A0A8T1YS53_ARASU|nr:Zinc finger SWIM-type [Arabidopsis suecica]